MTDADQSDGGGGVGLLELAEQLAQASAREAQAKSHRIGIETAILTFTGFKKAEGQETYPYEDERGSCSLVLKQGVNAKVDQAAAARLKKGIGGSLFRRIFRTEFKLNTKEARDLQEQDPETWATVSGAITRTPGKVSIKLTSLVMTKDGA